MVADSPYRKSTQTDADVDQLLSAASINVTKHCATGELPNVNMAVRKQFCGVGISALELWAPPPPQEEAQIRGVS